MKYTYIFLNRQATCFLSWFLEILCFHSDFIFTKKKFLYMQSVFLISVRTTLISEFILKRIAPSERSKIAKVLVDSIASWAVLRKPLLLIVYLILISYSSWVSAVSASGLKHTKQSLNELDIFAWREVLPALFHSAAGSKYFGFQRRAEVSANSPNHVQHKTTAAEFIY